MDGRWEMGGVETVVVTLFPIDLRTAISHLRWLSLILPLAGATAFHEIPGVKNVVYFDLETQKSADEVGGWDKIRDLKMSVGVTYSTHRGGYRIYPEREVEELMRELQRADLVVGFNVLRFDYEVLHGYTVFDLTQIPTLDMLVVIADQLRHRLSLDSIASATFGLEKTSEGLQAIKWFKEGRLLEIAEYCCYDVKLTKLVHEYGAQQRQLFYKNRFGVKLNVRVAW